jgi:hypothetical protein
MCNCELNKMEIACVNNFKDGFLSSNRKWISYSTDDDIYDVPYWKYFSYIFNVCAYTLEDDFFVHLNAQSQLMRSRISEYCNV